MPHRVITSDSPLMPNSTPISATIAPPVFENDAHGRTDGSGLIGLAHTNVNGADFVLWIWCSVMKAWIRAFEPGTIETLAQNTIRKFGLPQSAKFYIQSTVATTFYVGGAYQPNGNPYLVQQ